MYLTVVSIAGKELVFIAFIMATLCELPTWPFLVVSYIAHKLHGQDLDPVFTGGIGQCSTTEHQWKIVKSETIFPQCSAPGQPMKIK